MFGAAHAQQTQMIQVGDHALETVQGGEGEYTVVFEAGFGSDYKVWGKVASEIAVANKVLLYSRAGCGNSGKSANPQTLEQAVQDLSMLLEKANINTPLILVGHSYGAFIIRQYAALNKDKVKGMVFVDPAHERLMQELKKVDYAKAMNDVALQRSFMPERFKEENELINQLFEKAALPDAGLLPEVPVAVLTSVQQHAKPELFLHEPQGVEVWRRLHNEFFAQFANGAHILTSRSGHNIHKEEPELVVNAIQQVIQSATKERQRQAYQAKVTELQSKLHTAAAYVKKGQQQKAEELVFEALAATGFDEKTINAIGYQQLGNATDMPVAVLIFKYNAIQYASSANAYDSYGEALMSHGKLKSAKAQFEKAIALATLNKDTATLKSSENNLAKLKQQHSAKK
ncbi:alpha/beta fold hydrolase [Pontibacter oryzae]|uniref:Alpha/beta hydrolase n=1 Tax=Pontibacter oryzae TaxID=2304593 RepID=A0A399S036_9BACT|nr:alpha/beta hydrolase [Pontibacter oryzae]RIJ37366.1 alpha/beta hydrolase [Pontibacter oryzae]